MATLALDKTMSESNAGADLRAGAAVWSRISAFCSAVAGSKSRVSDTHASKAYIECDLAGLNDETLLDLGLDPAVARHGRSNADPLARFYF